MDINSFLKTEFEKLDEIKDETIIKQITKRGGFLNLHKTTLSDSYEEFKSFSDYVLELGKRLIEAVKEASEKVKDEDEKTQKRVMNEIINYARNIFVTYVNGHR